MNLYLFVPFFYFSIVPALSKTTFYTLSSFDNGRFIHSSSQNHVFHPQPLSNSEATTNDLITIDFDCKQNSDLPCQKIKSSLDRLKNNLLDIFDLKHGVRILVSQANISIIHSPEVLAAATPAYFVHEDNDPGLDPNFMYPPTLAKQLAKTNINFKRDDVLLFINQKLKHAFWYKDSGLPINGDKYDLDYILLHEVLHGMGFHSSFGQRPGFRKITGIYYSVLHLLGAFSPFSFLINFLDPLYVQTSPVNLVNPTPDVDNFFDESAYVKGFLRPTIFDKYVRYKDASGTHTFLSAWEKVASFCTKGTFLKWFSEFSESSESKTSEALHNAIIEKHSIFFDLGNEQALLFSSKPFSQLSSISNFDTAGDEKLGIIMEPAAPPGFRLESIVSRHDGNLVKAIGRWSSGVFRRMGYDLKGGLAGEKGIFSEQIVVPCSAK